MTPGLEELKWRVGAVANGRTINGTYAKMPIASLEAFKGDLRALLTAIEQLEARIAEKDAALQAVVDNHGTDWPWGEQVRQALERKPDVASN